MKMKFLIIPMAALLLGGCQTLIEAQSGPYQADPMSKYDKSMDTQTIRDCLSGKDDQSGQPNCFYQNRDRKDAEERKPPAPYGRLGVE